MQFTVYTSSMVYVLFTVDAVYPRNFKNLLNLCRHKVDFGIETNWIFFVTRHGKSSCNGIGGTVKRLY